MKKATIILAIIMAILCMNKEEKGLVTELLQRVRRKN